MSPKICQLVVQVGSHRPTAAASSMPLVMPARRGFEFSKYSKRTHALRISTSFGIFFGLLGSVPAVVTFMARPRKDHSWAALGWKVVSVSSAPQFETENEPITWARCSYCHGLGKPEKVVSIPIPATKAMLGGILWSTMLTRSHHTGVRSLQVLPW